MQPVLHMLEVSFRNTMYTASLKIVDESKLKFKDVPCWLDADPSLLLEKEGRSVEDAKEVLSRTKKSLTPGRLISKLGFGFWVGLCRAPYEQGRADGPGLWPRMIQFGFPMTPRPMRTRPHIYERFNHFRDIRNRISHHEPVWDRNLLIVHNEIIDTIGWISPALSQAVGKESILPDVEKRGAAAYLVHAERLIKKSDV